MPSFQRPLLGLAGLLASAVMCAAASSGPFNVRDYGAVGDGHALDTPAFASAIAACFAAGGGTVLVPPGRYLIGSIRLRSHMALQVGAGATLLGSENPHDYSDTEDGWNDGRITCSSLIYAQDEEDVTIGGSGTIDGQGRIWWEQVHHHAPSLRRPQLIRFLRCRNVAVEQVNLRNSAEWNIHPQLCEFVRVDGVTIINPVPSPNTDGVNPESCRAVQIVNCRIDTGDDCVTLKSGIDELGRRMGRPDEDIVVGNCVMYRGHGGVTIGSEMSGGVRNVVVSNCVFHGTLVGIRIKSQRGRGGVVEGVSVSNIVMQDVREPFVITTFYSGHDRPTDVYPVGAGTPRFRDFHLSNITARGARDAGSITGLRELPVSGVDFSNVRIDAGTGFVCTNAMGIVFRDVTINTERGPALILRRSHDVDTRRLSTATPHAGAPLVESEPEAGQ